MSHFKYIGKKNILVTMVITEVSFQELHSDTANLFTERCFYLQFVLGF